MKHVSFLYMIRMIREKNLIVKSGGEMVDSAHLADETEAILFSSRRFLHVLSSVSLRKR